MSVAGHFLYLFTLPCRWVAPALGLFVVARVGGSGQNAVKPQPESPSISASRSKVESNSPAQLRADAQSLAARGKFNDAAEIAVRLSSLDVRDPAGELIRAFDWHLRGGDLGAA